MSLTRSTRKSKILNMARLASVRKKMTLSIVSIISCLAVLFVGGMASVSDPNVDINNPITYTSDIAFDKASDDFEFYIRSYSDLQTLSNLVNNGVMIAGTDKLYSSAKYTVVNEITNNGNENLAPIGTSEHPFTGTFNGGGFKIKDVNISGTNHVGLFGYAENATIQNIELESGTITATGNYTGGVIGWVQNSVVSNLTNGATIQSTNGTNVGGVIGRVLNTNLNKIFNTGAVNGGTNVGGLVGNLTNSNLTEGVNTANIGGANSVGGLVGSANNTNTTTTMVDSNQVQIVNCFNSGNSASGLVGTSSGANQYNKVWITSCYSVANTTVGTIAGTMTNTELQRIYYLEDKGGTPTTGAIAKSGQEMSGEDAVSTTRLNLDPTMWTAVANENGEYNLPMLNSFGAGATLYSITYNANGGTISTDTSSYTSFYKANDTASDIKLAEPTRKGYSFQGWYSNGNLVTSETLANLDASISITADWILLNPTIDVYEVETKDGTTTETKIGSSNGEEQISTSQIYGNTKALKAEYVTINNVTYIKGWRISTSLSDAQNTQLDDVTKVTTTNDEIILPYDQVETLPAGTYYYVFFIHATENTTGDTYDTRVIVEVTIEKTALTIGVGLTDTSIVYGSSEDEFKAFYQNATYSGFVYGESAEQNGVLNGTLVFTVTDENGQVVTDLHSAPVGAYTVTPSGVTATNYNITFESASFEITKRPITITANSETKYYDGTPLTNSGYSVSNLVNGHSIQSGVTITGSITNVGSSANVASGNAVIVNAVGTNVTSNYSISYANGTLTINSVEVDVTVNGSMTYGEDKNTINLSWTTGFARELEQILISQLNITYKNGDTEITDFKNLVVGTYQIIIEPTTDNFVVNFNAENSKLTVNKRNVTITVGDYIGEYDGADHTASWELTSGSWAEGDTPTITTTTINEVGNKISTITSFIVKDGQTDVSGCYNYTVVTGNMSVSSKNITITTDSNQKVYDGTALTDDGWTISSGTLASGHTATVTITGTQTEVGTSDNTYEIVIKNASGVDVTENYTITEDLGTLTVTQATFTPVVEWSDTTLGVVNWTINTVAGKTPTKYTLVVNYTLADGSTGTDAYTTTAQTYNLSSFIGSKGAGTYTVTVTPTSPDTKNIGVQSGSAEIEISKVSLIAGTGISGVKVNTNTYIIKISTTEVLVKTGTAVEVQATTSYGYDNFNKWTITTGTLTGVDLTQNPLTFNAPSGNLTLSASANPNVVSITFDKQGGEGGTSSVTATYGENMPEIILPTRPGYDFEGYFIEVHGLGTQYYNADGTSATTWDKDSDTTLYAKWSEILYYGNFKYVDEMGFEDFRSEVFYGIHPLITPTNFGLKTGYTLEGWKVVESSDGNPYVYFTIGDVYDPGEEITGKYENVNFVAVYTANKYTVTLDKQNGEENDSVTATFDSAMPAITPPTRDGYIFNGYFKNTNGGGTKYYNADGTSVTNWNIASDTTLYASWTPITYTINFNKNTIDTNGNALIGSVTGSDDNIINCTYDQTITLLGEVYTITGYDLIGWNTNKDGTGTSYGLSATTSNLTTTNNATVTLYAQWELKTGIKVSFDAQGGTVDTASKNVDFGSTYGTLPTPTRDGWTFKEWTGKNLLNMYYTQNAINSTSSDYGDNWRCQYMTILSTNSVIITSTDPDAWFCSTIEITSLFENGKTYEFSGTASASHASITIEIQSRETNQRIGYLSNTTVVDTANYYYLLRLTTNNTSSQMSGEVSVTFSNLMIRETGTSATFEPYTVYTNESTVAIAEDHTLYAQYKPNKYTITFENEGGTGGFTSAEVVYSRWHTLYTTEAPTKAGYTFNGYYTQPNGGGTQWFNATKKVIHTYTLASDLTLYAYWTANEYTVTLDKQNGTGGADSVTATYGSAMPSIELPTRAGYTFEGYFSGENGSETQYYNADGSSANNWNIASDTTLYASWTANEYNIQVKPVYGSEIKADNSNVGDALVSTEATFDQEITITPSILNGYTITNWSQVGVGGSATGTSQTYKNLTTTAGETITIYVYLDLVAPTFTVEDRTFTYGESEIDTIIPSIGIFSGLTYETTGTFNGSNFEDYLSVANDTAVGTYTATFTVTVSDNYGLSKSTTKSIIVTINKKDLTVTLSPASGQATYGTSATFTLTFSGFANNETASVLSGTLNSTNSTNSLSGNVYTITTDPTLAIGTYTITVSGLSSSNYNFDLSTLSSTLTVGKKAITIKPNDVTYVYNGLDQSLPSFNGGTPNFQITEGGLVSGHEITYVSYTGSRKDVGSNSIMVNEITIMNGTTNVTANYELTSAPGTIEITPASLTVQVTIDGSSSKTITFGDENPELSVHYNGFVNNETESVLGGALSLTCSTLTIVDNQISGYPTVKTHTISASGYTSTNYDITYETGTLVVQKATFEPTITWSTTTNGLLSWSTPSIGGQSPLNYDVTIYRKPNGSTNEVVFKTLTATTQTSIDLADEIKQLGSGEYRAVVTANTPDAENINSGSSQTAPNLFAYTVTLIKNDIGISGVNFIPKDGNETIYVSSKVVLAGDGVDGSALPFSDVTAHSITTTNQGAGTFYEVAINLIGAGGDNYNFGYNTSGTDGRATIAIYNGDTLESEIDANGSFVSSLSRTYKLRIYTESVETISAITLENNGVNAINLFDYFNYIAQATYIYGTDTAVSIGAELSTATGDFGGFEFSMWQIVPPGAITFAQKTDSDEYYSANDQIMTFYLPPTDVTISATSVISSIYEVNYEMNGGTIGEGSYTTEYTYQDAIIIVDGVEIQYWGTIELPVGETSTVSDRAKIARKGYHFVGWQLTSVTAEEGEENDPGNTTWLDYYDIGDIIYMPDQLPDNIDAKYLDGSGNLLDKYNVENVIAEGKTGNVTLTAIWEAKTYTIVYNKNTVDTDGDTLVAVGGGVGTPSGDMADQTHTYDQTQNLTTNAYLITGYTFAGWNTKADGSGTSYTNGQTVTNLTATAGDTITLYAQWTPIEYHVCFCEQWYDINVEEGTITWCDTSNGFEAYKRIHVEYTIKTNIDLMAIANEHHYFDNVMLVDWFYTTLENWLVVEVIEPTNWENGKTYALSGTIGRGFYGDVYIAPWGEVKEEEITLDPSGGTVSPTTITRKLGDKFGILPEPTRPGYNFEGWYSYDADTQYGDGIVGPETMYLGEIQLTAIWTANTYNITMDNSASANDHYTPTLGELSASEYTTSTLEQTITISAVPQRTGYNLTGYAISGNTGTVSVSGTTITISGGTYGDITLTPIWEAIEYTVTLEYISSYSTIKEQIDGSYSVCLIHRSPFADKTTTTLPYTIESNEAIKVLASLGENRYTFEGWTVGSSNGSWDASVLQNNFVAGETYGDVKLTALKTSHDIKDGETLINWESTLTYTLNIDFNDDGVTDKTVTMYHDSMIAWDEDVDDEDRVQSIPESSIYVPIGSVAEFQSTYNRYFGYWDMPSGYMEATLRSDMIDGWWSGWMTHEGCDESGFDMLGAWQFIISMSSGEFDSCGCFATMMSSTNGAEVTITAKSAVGVELVVPEGAESGSYYDAMGVPVGATYAEGMWDWDDYGLPTASWTGYTFDGWYLEDTFETQVTNETTALEYNHTLYAKFTQIEYTITIDTSEYEDDYYTPTLGTLSKSIYTISSEDQEITIIIEPKRAGYNLTGYTISGYTGTVTVDGTTITISAGTYEKIILTPQWEETGYTATFYANEEDYEKGFESSDSYLGYAISDPVVTPTSVNKEKLGYTLVGWKVVEIDAQSNYGYVLGEVYDPGETITNKHGSICFVAVYEVNKYTVTFDPQGGTVDTTEKEVTFDSAYGTLPTPTKPGTTFIGWTGKNLLDLTTLTSWAYATATNVQANSVTITATNPRQGLAMLYDLGGILEPGKSYTVSGNCDNETYGQVRFRVVTKSTRSVRMYTTITGVDFNTYEYSLLISANKTSTAVTDGSTITINYSNLMIEENTVATTYEAYTLYTKDTIVSIASDHTLYASYDAKTYYLSYDANQPSDSPYSVNGVTNRNSGLYRGFSFNLNANGYSLQGWTFTGWNTEPDGSGTAYADKAAFNFLEPNDVILYAQWTPNKYIVTFDPNDGILVGDTEKEVTMGSEYGTLPTPTRDGYTFAGWMFNENFAPLMTSDNWTKNDFGDRTSTTFHTNASINGISNLPYARILGVQDADTAFQLLQNGTIAVAEGQAYTLSFYARTNQTGFFFQNGASVTSVNSWRIGIYWSDGTMSYMSTHMYVTADENWYKISATFTAPEGVTTAQIQIGTESSELNVGSYVDIANVRFAEETIASQNGIITSTSIVSTASDHTLYAQWIANEYTITMDNSAFASDNHTPTLGVLSKTEYATSTSDQTITISTVPSRAGYNLTGYTISGDYTGNVTVSGTTITISANTYGNIVVKPTWQAIEYTVTVEYISSYTPFDHGFDDAEDYYDRGFTRNIFPSTVTETFTYTIESSSAIKTLASLGENRYTFKGWTVDSIDGEGWWNTSVLHNNFSDGWTYGNVKLTALTSSHDIDDGETLINWESTLAYTVNIDFNGDGEENGMDKTVTMYHDSVLTWDEDYEEYVKPNNDYSSIYIKIGSKADFESTYNRYFYVWDGLTDGDYIYDSYNLSGLGDYDHTYGYWSTLSELSEYDWSEDENKLLGFIAHNKETSGFGGSRNAYIFGLSDTNNDVTLTPRTAIVVNLIVPDLAENAVDNMMAIEVTDSMTYGQAYCEDYVGGSHSRGIENLYPWYTGHNFEGWYFESTFETQVTDESPVTQTSTISHNIYGKFTIATYTITYKDKGGSTFSGTHEEGYPTTYTYGIGATLKSATKEGYVFGGWYTSSYSGTAVTSISSTATGNKTFYANWIRLYTVTFNPGAGTIIDGESTMTIMATQSPWLIDMSTFPTAELKGWKYDYWFEDSDADGIWDDGEDILHLSNNKIYRGELDTSYGIQTGIVWSIASNTTLTPLYYLDLSVKNGTGTDYESGLSISGMWLESWSDSTSFPSGSGSETWTISTRVLYGETVTFTADGTKYYLRYEFGTSTNNTTINSGGALSVDVPFTTDYTHYSQISKSLSNGNLTLTAWWTPYIDLYAVSEIDGVLTNNNATGGTVAVGNNTGSAYASNVMGFLTSSNYQTQTFTAVATAKDGYEFVGWYTESACTNQVSTSTSYTFDSYDDYSDYCRLRLYARFEEKLQITVANYDQRSEHITKFTIAGTDYTGVSSATHLQNFNAGDTVAISLTSAGILSFRRWVKGSDWTSDTDKVMSESTSFTYTITQDDIVAGEIKFTACWTYYAYARAVTRSANGNLVVSNTTGGTVKSAASTTPTGTVYDRYQFAGSRYLSYNRYTAEANTTDGYEFKGWYLDSACTIPLVWNTNNWTLESDFNYTSATQAVALTNADGYTDPSSIYALFEKGTYTVYTPTTGVNLIENGHFGMVKTEANVGWDTSKNGTLVPDGGNWSKGYNSGVTNASTVYHAHLKDLNPSSTTVTDHDYVAEFVDTADNTWLAFSYNLHGLIETGKTYAVTYDVYRVSGNSRVTVGIYYRATGEDGYDFNAGVTTYNMKEIGVWETVTSVFTINETIDPNYGISLYFYGYYGSPGIHYLDNVSMYEVTATEYSTGDAIELDPSTLTTPTGWQFAGYNVPYASYPSNIWGTSSDLGVQLSGINTDTAKFGTSSTNISTEISSSNYLAQNGLTGKVYMNTLTTGGGAVVITPQFTPGYVYLQLNTNGGSGGTSYIRYKYQTNAYYTSVTSNNTLTGRITSITAPTYSGFNYLGHMWTTTATTYSATSQNNKYFVNSSGTIQNDPYKVFRYTSTSSTYTRTITNGVLTKAPYYYVYTSLKAQWEAQTYTIRYVGSDCEWESITVNAGGVAEIPSAVTIANASYTNGWKIWITNASGTILSNAFSSSASWGTSSSLGSTLTNVNTQFKTMTTTGACSKFYVSNLVSDTSYIVYMAPIFDVHLDYGYDSNDDGTNDSGVLDNVVSAPDYSGTSSYNEQTNLSSKPAFPTLTAPDGMEFVGWNTKADGSGTWVTSNDYILTCYFDTAIYYGIWEPKTYEIQFNYNYYGLGTGQTSQVETVFCTYGQEIQFPEGYHHIRYNNNWCSYMFKFWTLTEPTSANNSLCHWNKNCTCDQNIPDNLTLNIDNFPNLDTEEIIFYAAYDRVMIEAQTSSSNLPISGADFTQTSTASTLFIIRDEYDLIYMTSSYFDSFRSDKVYVIEDGIEISGKMLKLYTLSANEDGVVSASAEPESLTFNSSCDMSNVKITGGKVTYQDSSQCFNNFVSIEATNATINYSKPIEGYGFAKSMSSSSYFSNLTFDFNSKEFEVGSSEETFGIIGTFGTAGTYGLINNITVKNLILETTTTPQYFGSIVGKVVYTSSGDKVEMKNCKIDNVEFSLNNQASTVIRHMGLVAGYNYGTISNINVTNSSISYTEDSGSSTTYIGGAFGDVGSIDGCIVEAKVLGTPLANSGDATTTYLGGIAGYANGKVTNCQVVGSTIKNEYTKGATGGMVGYSFSATIEGEYDSSGNLIDIETFAQHAWNSYDGDYNGVMNNDDGDTITYQNGVFTIVDNAGDDSPRLGSNQYLIPVQKNTNYTLSWKYGGSGDYTVYFYGSNEAGDSDPSRLDGYSYSDLLSGTLADETFNTGSYSFISFEIVFENYGSENISIFDITLQKETSISNSTNDTPSVSTTDITGTNNVGGVVGYNYSGKILNMVVDGGGSSISGIAYVGGIAGYSSSNTNGSSTYYGYISNYIDARIASSSNASTISYCFVNNYNISGTTANSSNAVNLSGINLDPYGEGFYGSLVGGIVGYQLKGSIIACQVTQSSTITGTYGAVGGIVGGASNTYAISYNYVDDSIVIQSNGSAIPYGSAVGGIVGAYMYNNSANNAINNNYTGAGIARNTNFASVNGQSSVGGIVGYISVTNTSTTDHTILQYNSNHGSITAQYTGTSNGPIMAGGIAGRIIERSSSGGIIINHNLNTGDVEILNSTTIGIRLGGIVGIMLIGTTTNASCIQENINAGRVIYNVSSNWAVGPIMGGDSTSSGNVTYQYNYYYEGCRFYGDELVATTSTNYGSTSKTLQQIAELTYISGSSYVRGKVAQGYLLNDASAPYAMPYNGLANKDAPVVVNAADLFNKNSSGEFQITSLDDLKKLERAIATSRKTTSGTYYRNEKYIVTNNISGIDFYINSFGGTFNGNSKTLTLNLSGSSWDKTALFLDATNATFKNLNLAGTVSGGDYTASLVAKASNCTFTSVTNSATVNGDNYVGGIVAEATGSKSFTSVRNTGAVTGAQDVGGIVGSAYGTSSADQLSISTGCSNSGSITGDKNVGGIVGYGSNVKIQGTSSSNVVTNSGTINGGSGGSEDNIGGIIGYAYSSTIKYAKNTGSIKPAFYSGSVGGIVGCAESNTTISNCTNSSSTQISSSNSPYMGGIAGRINRSTITNCTNSTSLSGGSIIGGIVGSANNQSNISACTNSGSVQGSSYIGGLAGQLIRNSTITGSGTNSGTITATALNISYVGGIVGIIGQESGVYDTSYIQGTSSSHITNNGVVYGRSNIGGIAGYVSKGAGYTWSLTNTTVAIEYATNNASVYCNGNSNYSLPSEYSYTDASGYTIKIQAGATRVFAGGIAGESNSGIVNAINTGNVMPTSGSSGLNVGGQVITKDGKTFTLGDDVFAGFGGIVGALRTDNGIVAFSSIDAGITIGSSTAGQRTALVGGIAGLVTENARIGVGAIGTGTFAGTYVYATSSTSTSYVYTETASANMYDVRINNELKIYGCFFMGGIVGYVTPNNNSTTTSFNLSGVGTITPFYLTSVFVAVMSTNPWLYHWQDYDKETDGLLDNDSKHPTVGYIGSIGLNSYYAVYRAETGYHYYG